MMYSNVSSVLRVILLILVSGEVWIGIVMVSLQLYERFRRGLLAESAVITAVSYLLFLQMLAIHREENAADLYVWLIVLFMVLFAVLECQIIVQYQLWMKNSFTISSVREAIEQMPAAICVLGEEGAVGLSNRYMEQIISEKVKKPLRSKAEIDALFASPQEGLPGEEITAEESERLLQLSDETSWEVSRRAFQSARGTCQEIHGFNVSEEIRIRRELQENQKELEGMNRRLKEMNRSITVMIAERELLQAKIRIHDQLSRAIYMTEQYSEYQNPEDRETVLQEWELITKLFRQKQPEYTSASCEENLQAAENMGIRCVVDGELPRNPRMREIAAAAIGVHAANVRKHANGSQAWITCRKQGRATVMIFTNNGMQPDGEITEGGGLGNLRRMAEDAGAKMEIRSVPAFTLKLVLPEGTPGKEEVWYTGY